MSSLADVHLIDAVRTVFGKNRGALSGIRTDDLAALPIQELVARHPALDPTSGEGLEIDDVYYGNTNGAGEENRNVARMAALLAGLPVTVPGVTVNRLCASGGEAVVQASRAVATGDADLVIAGGVEGMSRAPFVLPRPDEALPRSMELHQTTVGWRLVNPRFPDEWTRSLGESAQRVAEEKGIGRAEQDEWAARSHQLVAAAYDQGRHEGFVMPLNEVQQDETLRRDSTPHSLGALRPAFTADGAVTAGNSSPISDGALAALVGTRAVAERMEVEPLARIVGSATVGVSPERFAVAPVPAIAKLLKRAGLSHQDIDLWEINEAFAAMVLSTLDELPEVDRERVNVNGGAIAIGHPLGASAPRVIVDLARELRRRGGGVGVAAACIGVGLGQAVLVRVD
ncbi:MAG TPA: thiolase family protein [Intrasporangium sp.]|uniref:thiolase family protein n=1 Tax=Intrasporangium sp. TaxID=1925024 RepID=UPI002B499AF3|nr:thiolase family protein [Intrasporangium sp.]HKX67099.1 thiolase family protein [Intrasporangium sp.]